MYVIEQWLKGPRNFYVGKAIYQTIGTDKKLLEVLNNGKTPIAEQLLLTALQKHCEQPKRVIAQQIEVDAGVMPESNDPVLKSVREEWLKPYQEMNYKRHKLDEYKGDGPDMVAKRKTLAFEILELEQQCIKIWKKRDHYLQHGKLPDASTSKKELPTDPVELGKYISNLGKNIRRNKKLMKDFPDKPVYVQNYQQYKQEYIDVTGKEYQEKN